MAGHFGMEFAASNAIMLKTQESSARKVEILTLRQKIRDVSPETHSKTKVWHTSATALQAAREFVSNGENLHVVCRTSRLRFAGGSTRRLLAKSVTCFCVSYPTELQPLPGIVTTCRVTIHGGWSNQTCNQASFCLKWQWSPSNALGNSDTFLDPILCQIAEQRPGAFAELEPAMRMVKRCDGSSGSDARHSALVAQPGTTTPGTAGWTGKLVAS